MLINNKHEPADPYHLRNMDLEIVQEEKDIRDIIDNNLSFAQHRTAKVTKANCTFTFRRRIQYLDTEISIHCARP